MCELIRARRAAKFDGKRPLAWLLVPLLGALVSPQGQAQAPAPPAPVLSEAQQRIAYAELQSIGTLQHTFYISGSPDEAKIRDVQAKLTLGQSEIFIANAGLKKMTYAAIQMPPALRNAVRNTAAYHVSAPFKMGDKWVLVMPVGIAAGTLPAYEQVKDKLAEFVHAGTIPHPDDAMKLPLVTQYAASQVSDPVSFARLAEPYDPDLVLPDGSTMLIDALLRGKVDLATALLAHHASPNKCAGGYCPLHAAVVQDDPIAAVKLLVEHGASVDVVDSNSAVVMTPLASAMLRKRSLELAELLLAKGANADGVPGEIPPVVMAAEMGNKAAIELLRRHGADLYKRSTAIAPSQNALTAAAGGKADPAFKSWLLDTWTKSARNAILFDWKAWIEQDGKRSAVDGKPILLHRRPFDIVVEMDAGRSLLVATSTEHAVLDEFAHGEGRSQLYSFGSVAAETCDATSAFLSVNTADSKAPDLRIIQSWYDSDSCREFNQHEPNGSSRRYTRKVDQLYIGAGKDKQKVELAESTVDRIYVVMGTQLDLAIPWLTYIGPKSFELRFQP